MLIVLATKFWVISYLAIHTYSSKHFSCLTHNNPLTEHAIVSPLCRLGNQDTQRLIKLCKLTQLIGMGMGIPKQEVRIQYLVLYHYTVLSQIDHRNHLWEQHEVQFQRATEGDALLLLWLHIRVNW